MTGGFPYSASKLGIEPVWASEIEAFPIKVTQHHFPNMKHLGDITKINGAEIEPVDVITFGSPCQDLSVAGKRAGLEGLRSGLFSDAVRIIREMREATNGIYPRYAVWENVPGAFSSNKGLDFRAVLEEIGNAEIPMPKSGRWATAGMVRAETADIAWRVLDAQYWGGVFPGTRPTPQRRKRIFLVADFGGTSAAEILFIEQGLSGNPAESGKPGQEVAGDAGDGVDKSSIFDPYNNAVSEKCTSLGSNCGMSTGRSIVCKAAGFKGEQSAQARGIGWQEEIAPTLPSEGATPCICLADRGIIPFDTTQITSPQNGCNPKPNDPCHPLCATAHVPSIAIPIENHPADSRVGIIEDGKVQTLTSRMGTGGGNVPMIMEPQVIAIDQQGGKGTANYEINKCPTLCSDSHGTPHAVAFQPGNISRQAGAEPSTEVFPTLGASTLGDQFPCVAMRMREGCAGGGKGPLISEDKSLTLGCGNDQTIFATYWDGGQVSDCLTASGISKHHAEPDKRRFPAVMTYGMDLSQKAEGIGLKPELGACVTSGTHPGPGNHILEQGYAVHRLTPTECLRLQGFPDWWLDIDGASDTAKYKAIGNSIAVPCVDYIMSGIARVLKNEKN